MASIDQNTFTTSLLALLRDTFEGPGPDGGSFYLDEGSGLVPTLGSLGARAASRAPEPGAPTIAAHCAHLSYYVFVVGSAMAGRAPKSDWPASWRPDRVDDREWDELREKVKSEYRSLMETVGAVSSWDDGKASDALAILAHTAYHLGAIRRIARGFGGMSRELS